MCSQTPATAAAAAAATTEQQHDLAVQQQHIRLPLYRNRANATGGEGGLANRIYNSSTL
jgi:hypothetical protein